MTWKRLSIILFTLVSIAGAEINVDQIKKAIRENNAGWRATENRFTRMSAAERSLLTGAVPIDPLDVHPDQIITFTSIEQTLPDSFDWRDNSGNWVTSVKDQGQCGSCWAFSALGQVEAWWKIQNGDVLLDIDLSEQALLACSRAGNCEEGGSVWRSLEYITREGIPLERDLPYQARSNVPCSDVKPDWQERAVTIPGWGYVTWGESNVENIKNAVSRHPLSVSFEVFADFYSYAGGVYEHVFGESSGWHAVVIVGWNDREQSWIVKNSWGESWGDKGYFRIKWNNSNMGRFSPFIWDQIIMTSVYPLETDISFDLIYGDEDSKLFTLKNFFENSAEYYVNEMYEDEIDWLDLSNNAGILEAGTSVDVAVKAYTRDLNPGTYSRTLGIFTNDGSQAQSKVLVHLNLTRPEIDSRMKRIILPVGGASLFSRAQIGCEIDNYGADTIPGLDVICDMEQNGELFYSDTISVENLASLSGKTMFFRPFMPKAPGEWTITTRIVNVENDYNAFNDSLTTSLMISNLVDGFETMTSKWHMQGGWGITNQLNGHEGSSAAHVYSGAYPYPGDMNGLMTYVPGFDVGGLDSLFVTFWTRYVTADDNDYCQVEVSVDSLIWEEVDRFNGVNPIWNRHVLDLSTFARDNQGKVWLRFRFISDAEGGSIGVLIDDVEVFTTAPEGYLQTTIDDTNSNTSLDYRLSQNYPNPFNPTTTIEYSLSSPAEVLVSIYNMQGRLVERLVDQSQQPGTYTAIWDAADRSSGVYVYTLETLDEQGIRFVDRKKMILIR